MLRLGRYQTVLADVKEVSSVIADPPYSAKTHRGHNARPGKPYFRPSSGRVDSSGRGRDLSYSAWSEGDVREFVEAWAPRCAGWMCVFSDDVLASVWRAEAERAGRYAFAPVPCVIRAMTVRMSGDGPSSWAIYLNVSRPRDPSFIGKKQPRGGTRPGAYVLNGRGGARTEEHIGGKPLELMRLVVADYTLPGDLVCDPCAGYATTGAAALALGRRFVGAEVDVKTCLRGLRRLRSVQLDGDHAEGPSGFQLPPAPHL
jgi:hypothetical protein